MNKTAKAKAIMKLLKQGYSPREVTQRMDASYNYAWKLKKLMEAGVEAEVEPKTTILSVDTNVYPNITPEFAFSLSQGRQKRREEAIKAEAGEYVVVEGAKSAQEVDAILNARASTYGSFINVALFAQDMKEVIRSALDEQNVTLQADHQEALDMIASKIARIITGDSHYIDSWLDIAGYATLVADRLQGKIR